MKVKALEGDTVDSLCFRYYGTTQGVTEKVLDANPGLCQQVFLDAGQEVEMPEPEKKKREMIQLACGVLAMAVAGSLRFFGIPEDAVTFFGASIGFMGAEKARDKVIAIFDRRVKERNE